MDAGFALPWAHSSIWLRTAAGTSPGPRDDPFANFYFGGFGNNWVDRGEAKRYRDYYAFPDTLDVDRYTIGKTTRDAVVAVREINLLGLPDNQRNWLNDHTVYTHGYGFYAAYGNQRTTEGDPVFFEGGGRSAIGEYQPRIFDRFWQARKSDRQGAGLGLAIAKGIVEAHHGRIWVESSVGEGSRFYFTLPAAHNKPRSGPA